MPAQHSVLHPLGAHAQHIDFVWHTMLWVCGSMYLLVMLFLGAAWLRRRRVAADAAAVSPETGMERLLMGWSGIIVAGLFGLTLASYLTDRSLVEAATEPQISLRVTGHQWWWQVEYDDPDSSRIVRTANEIHLPVDSQVHVALNSTDVIHSFWVPNLNGKRDLIPGRSSEIRLQPRVAGRYRGFCAEFCGVQHAYMQFEVVVESPAEFAAWKSAQLAPSATPTDAATQEGQNIFMRSACALCHAIAGTDASATNGPDLSHFASRPLLASGALPNTPQNLRTWLANPQQVKPGNHMPVVSLQPRELDALVTYLSSLR